MALSQEHVRLGIPHIVYWDSWKTDTISLQRCGWQLSAIQHHWKRSVQLAMKHPSGIVLIAESYLQKQDYYPTETRFEFRVSRVLHEDTRIVTIHDLRLSDFSPVNALPSFINREEAILKDLIAFAPLVLEEKEIIVAPQSVQQILEELLRQQEPGQAEIRRRNRYEQPVQLHAQILTFGT